VVRYQRLLWLERKTAERGGVLTEAQMRLLRKARGRLTDPEQHIEAPHPGHLLCQDYRIYKKYDQQARKRSGLDAIAHFERMRSDARHSLGFMPAPEGEVHQEHHNQNAAESADDRRACWEIPGHR